MFLSSFTRNLQDRVPCGNLRINEQAVTLYLPQLGMLSMNVLRVTAIVRSSRISAGMI